MPRTTLHWTDSLIDSVFALGEAAREYRHAYQAASLATAGVSPDRRTLHEGKIRRTEPDGTAAKPHEPHAAAVLSLSKHHAAAESELKRRYEHAALLYASGAAWAIDTTRSGAQPAAVVFLTGEDGGLRRRALHIDPLERYAGMPYLTAAYESLMWRLNAADYAEELSGQTYVTDHEAGELTDAVSAAAGIADAALAFGGLAEPALHFVLITPRRDRDRELRAAHHAAAGRSPDAAPAGTPASA